MGIGGSVPEPKRIINIAHYDPRYCPHTDKVELLGWLLEYACLNYFKTSLENRGT